MIKKTFSNQDGLTLIEVIIAMTILAFIMVSVVQITNTSLDRSEIILAEDREILQIESALDRIEWDFSQIYTPLFFSREFTIDPKRRQEATEKFKRLKSNPLYARSGKFSMPSYYGQPIPIFLQEAKQSFEFFTKGHRRKMVDTKESDFAWVKYEFREPEEREEGKEDTLELVRFYVAKDIYNSQLDIKEAKPFVLAENIIDFEFSFWNEEREKWEPDLRTVKNGDRMIRGFKVKLTWKRAAGGEEVTERVFRSIWPYFEPEDMNEEMYKDINGQQPGAGRNTGNNQDQGGNEDDGDDEDGDEDE